MLVPSIILHEVSHGVAALGFGDDTAKRAGRITLNPVSHVDPFGTVLLPLLMAALGGPAFGYAKPVPINPSRMRNPRNDAVWVALAGPATNIVLAILAAIALRTWSPTDGSATAVRLLLYLGVMNAFLAAFNLLPIPPLDGSAVVGRLLPRSMQMGWMKVQQYGMAILIAGDLPAPAAPEAGLRPCHRPLVPAAVSEVGHLARRFFGVALAAPAGARRRGLGRGGAPARRGRDLAAAEQRRPPPRHRGGPPLRVGLALVGRRPPCRAELAGVLLHDCGKLDSGLGTLRRVGATVWLNVRGERAGEGDGRIARYARHEEIGAQMLLVAGSDPVTVALVARSADAPEPALTVLAAADHI